MRDLLNTPEGLMAAFTTGCYVSVFALLGVAAFIRYMRGKYGKVRMATDVVRYREEENEGTGNN